MKLPFIPPDIEQAITHIIRLTLQHNALQIALAILIVLTIAWALYKPARSKILLLVGFLGLLLYLQYIKHIMGPLLEQTLVTTTTEIPRYRFMWFQEKVITKGVPIVLGFGSTGAILSGIVLWYREKSQQNTN